MATKPSKVPLGVVLAGDVKAGSVKPFPTVRALYHLFAIIRKSTDTKDWYNFSSCVMSLLPSSSFSLARERDDLLFTKTRKEVATHLLLVIECGCGVLSCAD